jgi:hypothetical protein
MGDPAIADVVRRSVETARESETIRADAERQIEEVLAIREAVTIDPVGFTLRQLAESPAGQDHLVLALLSQPAVFERLRETVSQMVDSPEALRLIAAEQKAARAEYREQATHEMHTQRAVRENLDEVKASCGAIARMLPEAIARRRPTTTCCAISWQYADQRTSRRSRANVPLP